MSEENQVSIDEIAVSNMVSIEAMVRILVKRGFITKEEIMDEVNKCYKKWYDFRIKKEKTKEK